ncbi:MAG TPA: response regulator [Nitrospirota bacterium]|nr:response regulator [Nitrospirota bacterium]
MQPTILIIDDNEDDVLLMKFALSKTGRDLVTEVALSGEAGLALIRGGTTPPNLILLDLKMSGMDGIEVLRKIRDDQSLSGIPVVIVTHSDLASDKQAALQAGADSFMHKAPDLDQFKRDIERVLDTWLRTDAPSV